MQGTREGMDGKEMIKTVKRKSELVGDGFRRAPVCTLIIGRGEEDIGIHAVGGQVHPGTIEAAAMRSAGTVSSAGGIHQRATERFGRNQSLEIERFRGDHGLCAPGLTSIERAVEGDSSVAKVAPGDVEL